MRGYPGVARTDTFPEVVRRRIRTERPASRIPLSAGEFYHPAELPRAIRRTVGRADILVIDVAAFFVANAAQAVDVSAFPRGVQTVYDRARHLRAAANRMLDAYPRGQQWVQLIETSAIALTTGILRPLIRRYPRPTIAEYERILVDSVVGVRARDKGVVLQGPAGFNAEGTFPTYTSDAIQLFADVNELAHRVGARCEVPVVDRMAIVGVRGNAHFFCPGSIRYSRTGHQITGEALAEVLLQGGLL